MNNATNTQKQMTSMNKGQQDQPGQDLLISPINTMTSKISDGTNSLTNLLNKFKTIPEQINQLRKNGSGQVTALKKQLSDLNTTLANENSAYVSQLVTKINNINASLDGLKNNITVLGSKADEITTALGQANNSTAGVRNSPTSVVPGPGNATGVGLQKTKQQRQDISAKQNRQGPNNVGNMVANLGSNQINRRRGGKRSRKIRRKYSKKHSKKLRRSSK